MNGFSSSPQQKRRRSPAPGERSAAAAAQQPLGGQWTIVNKGHQEEFTGAARHNDRAVSVLTNNGTTHHHHKHSHSAASGRGSGGYPDATSESMEMDHLPSSDAEDLSSDEGEIGLTKQQIQQRRAMRREANGLDRRIGGRGSPATTTTTGQSDADRTVLRSLGINGLLVLLWYFFSLSISIYNKWMFSKKYLDFHYPLFVTCFHMLVQFCLAGLVLYFVPRLRPKREPLVDQAISSSVTADDDNATKPIMTRKFYLTRIGPCGAATGLDIGLGNMSLKFITLKFYTMCKSSSLAFVLIFAFIFRLEQPSVRLVAIIFTMTVGVVMMVAGEIEFDALGFVLVILAAFFSGFRWSLTQILLLRSPATSNPFSSIFFLAPVMFVSLAVIAVPVEGLGKLIEGTGRLLAAKGVFSGLAILTFPGFIAFLMTASEFALLQRTSVVTLSICGIFKEVVTIAAAAIAFGDPLTPINVSGLIVTLLSISAYNYIKITKMRDDARMAASGGTGRKMASYGAQDGALDRQVAGEDEAAEPMLGLKQDEPSDGEQHLGAQQPPRRTEPSSRRLE